MNRPKGIQRNFIAVIIIITGISGLISCEKYTYNPPKVDPNTEWKLSTDIQPIFNSNCTSCHSGAKLPDLSQGKSYNSLTKGGFVTLPAETSRLYSKMISADHAARSTETEKLKVLYWITQGAKNN